MHTNEPTTIRHRVGTCPACRAYLWADVDIAVELDKPTVDQNGKPHVNAFPRFMGMRVEHSCQRDQDEAWEVLA